MNKRNYMITAKEVADEMDVSLGYAYKILRQLNKELANEGYITVSGKVPRAFWEKKFFGYSQMVVQRGEKEWQLTKTKKEEHGMFPFTTKIGQERIKEK